MLHALLFWKAENAMGETRRIVLVGADGTEWYSVRTYETVADCYPTSLVPLFLAVFEQSLADPKPLAPFLALDYN